MLICPISNKPVDVVNVGKNAWHVRSWAGRWFCTKTFLTEQEAISWRETFVFPKNLVPQNQRFCGSDWMSERLTDAQIAEWPKTTRRPRGKKNASVRNTDQPAS